MKQFVEHHRNSIDFTYCSLDRVVCNAVIQPLQRGNAVVAFFCQGRGLAQIHPQLFRRIASQMHHHIQQLAQRHRLEITDPPKDERRDDFVAPYYQRLARRRSGLPVAVILKARECSRIAVAYKTTGHPHIELKNRFVDHYTVYLDDPQLGPMQIRFCPYFPFHVRLILNPHHWLARQLRQQQVPFRQCGNAFLSCSDPQQLQKLAHRFSHWPILYALRRWFSFFIPFFSMAERRRYEHRLFLSQVEYSINAIFRQRFPAEQLFQRLLDHNRQIGHPQTLSVIFQKRMHRRTAAKTKTRISHPYDANPAIRSTYKTNWVKQYLRDRRLLRTEAVCNNPYDFGVNKSIDNLTLLRRRLHDVVTRYLDVQQDVLETYLDAGQLRRLGQPTLSPSGRRTPGLKLDDPRLLAVMQAIVSFTHLASGGQFTTKAIHAPVARALQRTPETYTLSQLRYDLGKLRAKGLVQKIPRTHRYQLTPEGYRVCVLFLKLFHRVYAPLTAAAVEPRTPNHTSRPAPQPRRWTAPRPRCDHQQRPSRFPPDLDPSVTPDHLATLDRLYVAVDRALDELFQYLGLHCAA